MGHKLKAFLDAEPVGINSWAHSLEKALWRDKTSFKTSLLRFLEDLTLSASYLFRQNEISCSILSSQISNSVWSKLVFVKRDEKQTMIDLWEIPINWFLKQLLYIPS